jgi:hypothetical protein
MRNADLTQGTAYVVDRGWPQGKGVYLGPSDRRGYVRMDFPDRRASTGEPYGERDIRLQNISREWDHPDAQAERAAQLELRERAERARDLLETLTFTVGRPGQRRQFGDPGPAAHVVTEYGTPVVKIDLDAFLAVFDVRTEDHDASPTR